MAIETSSNSVFINKKLKDSVDNWLVNTLLYTDGSTTRMLETLVNGKVSLKVHHQEMSSRDTLSIELSSHFTGEGPLLRRVTSLYFNSEIISTNVVLADLSLLSGELQQGIYQGQIPLGKLITGLESRRQLLISGYRDTSPLQGIYYPFKLAEKHSPVKEYLILQNNHTCFYICEIFEHDRILDYFWKAREN